MRRGEKRAWGPEMKEGRQHDCVGVSGVCLSVYGGRAQGTMRVCESKRNTTVVLVRCVDAVCPPQ